jgi:hypothetical protein
VSSAQLLDVVACNGSRSYSVVSSPRRPQCSAPRWAGIAWGDLGVGYFIIGLVLWLVAGRQDRVRKVPISDSYIATAF